MSDRDAAPCPLPHAFDPDRPRTPDHGLLICRGHARALPERIMALGSLHDQLAANLTQAGARGEPITGTTEHGIAINTAVVELRHAIRNELAGWCRIVVEDRDIHPPERDDAPSLAGFLATHAVWISTQEWVTDLWAALIADPAAKERDQETKSKADKPRPDTRALTSKARSALKPGGPRKANLGEPCPDCGGGLLVLVREEDDVRPSDLWCEGCGRNWRPEEWLRLGKRIKAKETA